MRRLGLKFLLIGSVLAASTYASLSIPAQRPTSPAPSNPQSLLSTADAVFHEMSGITGLPIKGPLKKQIISRSEIRKYLTQTFHEDYTPEEVHVQEATLKAFGLVPPSFDLEKFLIAFYTEQAAGFYDPHSKTMFIADWVEPDLQQMVLAHELTHALQDQNFDLEKFLHGAAPNDDATNARQAIVEGYAMAAMMQTFVAPLSIADLPSLNTMMSGLLDQQYAEFPAFSSAPFFFRFQALFPYAQGTGFIQRGLARGGGWQKLNRVFLKPPTSTAEIFDPDCYFNALPLPEVSLPAPAPLSADSQLHKLSENVMGELGYYSILGQLISESEAKAVATKWVADRYILYESPAKDAYAIVARTRWDSVDNALAFFRDLKTILEHKYSGLAPEKRSIPNAFTAANPKIAVVMLRKDDEILWAEGIPAEKEDAVLNYLKSL